MLEKLNAYKDEVVSVMKQIVLEDKIEELRPFLVAFGWDASGESMAGILDAAPIFEDDSQKFERMFISGQSLAETGFTLEAMFLVAEAWMTKPEIGTAEEDMIRPSLDPTRQEIVMVTGIDTSDDSVYVFFPIIRNEDNIMSLGEEEENPELDQAKSKFYLGEKFIEGYVSGTLSAMSVTINGQEGEDVLH